MFSRISTISLPMLMTQFFPNCSLSAAESLNVTPAEYPREILYAEMPAEIVRDDERFKNIDDDSQLRHHINTQHIEKNQQKRPETQTSEGKKSQTLHQTEQQPGEESLNQPSNGGDGAPR